MYRFHANLQSVSTDFRYETGVSTPGGLCHKADKFSVGFRAIAFFGFWAIEFLGGWAIEFEIGGG
ncbi:hypothetical protein [Microcoleus sp.]|uniref:hypothetical protein n=1 Tax=Microcoleus sp. TaxID=44472 RepID=UPI0035256DB6